MERPAIVKKDDPGRIPRWLALLGSNLFDAASTQVALSRSGTKEGNPAMRGIAGNPAALFGLKGLVGAGEALLMDLVAKKGNTKAANITAGAISGLNGAVGISNLTKGK